jgi:hypothetical protein
MVKEKEPIVLDFSNMSIGALRESRSVLKEVKPDPIVNLILSKIKQEMQRRLDVKKS